MLLIGKITGVKSKWIKAIGYYLTIGFLFADPIYLTVLFNFVGGGDMNAIVYLLPQIAAQVIFAVILVLNVVLFFKYVLPKYKKAFEVK